MSYRFLGKLPDPFMKADGTRMTADDWYAKRDEIFRDLCDKEFGGIVSGAGNAVPQQYRCAGV